MPPYIGHDTIVPPARGGGQCECADPGRADSTDAGLQLWQRESIAYFLLQVSCEGLGPLGR